MNSIKVLFLICYIGIVLGSNCRDLTGVWRNQLGSNMTIIHMDDTRISGEYSTAVESRLNAAVVSSNITGNFQYMGDGALVSFTVIFNRGKSLTTWVGQCLPCEGEEVLFTSWTLRTYVQKRNDRWMAYHINQDIFKRVPGYENVPHHLRINGPWPQESRSEACEKNIKAGPNGKWVAENSEAFSFDECLQSGSFKGLRENNNMYGRSDGGNAFTALGFVSGSVNTVRGWAGHIYEEELRYRILETTWFSHTYSDNCRDPFRDLRIGMTNYTFDPNYGESSGNSLWQTILSYVRQ